MDTEKQRQCRCNNARLTESGNARSEQLLVAPTESLTNREWLPGELLSGSEHQRPGCFFDMKYQTCLQATYCINSYVNLSPVDPVSMYRSHSHHSLTHYQRITSSVLGLREYFVSRPQDKA